jgi:hypothetical protein
MSAVWTTPDSGRKLGSGSGSPDRMHAGEFLIQNGKIVAQAKTRASPAARAAQKLDAEQARGASIAAAAPQPEAVRPASGGKGQ